MRNTKRILALTLSVILLVALLAGCAKSPDSNRERDNSKSSGKPLVVETSELSGKFSPFFAESAFDQDIQQMTQIALVTTDRQGAVVFDGIKGETRPYNGTDYKYYGPADVKLAYASDTDLTTYTFVLRDDLKFSDGKKVTADDLIFSLYAYCDPTYTGSATIGALNILGLQEYRYQSSVEMSDKYKEMINKIFAAGINHAWSSEDTWTQEMQNYVWKTMNKDWWKTEVEAIVDYCVDGYTADFAAETGFTEEEIAANEWLKVAVGMRFWGFAKYDATATDLTAAVTGKKWTLKGTDFPTIDDYVNETIEAYAGNGKEFFSVESAGATSDIIATLESKFVIEFAGKDPESAGASYKNISGIKKINDTTVEIQIQGFDAAAIYRMAIEIAPMHYYGEEAKYDYANNKFGFDFADLSHIASMTPNPMGAGAYVFEKYENKVVTFKANKNYYKGEPKIAELQFKVTAEADKTSGVKAGTIDISSPSFSKKVVDEIMSYNSNQLTTGDVITTSTVDNLGYGYIGINSETVKIGADKASKESKDFRRAFATLFSVYRDTVIDTYYGERASVINYPISNTSWAAPQKTDDGYKVAFSVGADKKDLYTSTMSPTDKFAAAEAAAKAYFEAAGCTFGADGKVATVPTGAKKEYEIIIPGGGNADHPSFGILTEAKAALERLGFTLIINDPADANLLWEKLDTGLQEMWCAAWQATPDPDMYQTYHSTMTVAAGGNSNHYCITDPALDQLIVDARKSDDQATRRTMYKAALDVIIDWAVEIPVYQRQNAIIFSTERVDIESLTPDITTFWVWSEDIELLKMK